MTMSQRLRRFALTVHIVCSISWIGALAAFLALALIGLTAGDIETVRTAYGANALITWNVIIPLALAALLTGIVQALGTPWGLFRNYWVVIKLMIILIATAMLLMKAGPISDLAAAAAEDGMRPDLLGLRVSVTVHAAVGLLVLLWAAALGTYRPVGLTHYGWRKQHGVAANR